MKHTVLILGVLAIAAGVTSAPASAQETVAASPFAVRPATATL